MKPRVLQADRIIKLIPEQIDLPSPPSVHERVTLVHAGLMATRMEVRRSRRKNTSASDSPARSLMPESPTSAAASPAQKAASGGARSSLGQQRTPQSAPASQTPSMLRKAGILRPPVQKQPQRPATARVGSGESPRTRKVSTAQVTVEDSGSTVGSPVRHNRPKSAADIQRAPPPRE